MDSRMSARHRSSLKATNKTPTEYLHSESPMARLGSARLGSHTRDVLRLDPDSEQNQNQEQEQNQEQNQNQRE